MIELDHVEEIMTSRPLTVTVDTHATRVRSILREDGFRALPVVNNHRLEGIITRGDIMNISATKSNVDARGVMQHPKVITTPDVDIRQLARNLLKADTVQAPVVESADSMQLVGIVSAVDILRKFLYNGKKPAHNDISSIFTRDVVTCTYDEPISKVWDLMDETGFSGLPVIKNKKLIGIITRKDIIDSGHVRIGRESGEIKRSIRVEKVMKTPPLVTTPQNSVTEVAQMMIEYDIGRLPVVENPVYVKKEPNRATKSDLIGIIAREDILWSYLG
ncbi:MAG: Inosine-5'-monophosphate dehydrogenase [Methanobacterium sp. PtaU1.Bin097]|nr:MAG: Inosine-5'-monophosphate dehydrogenase [Methanobacterium sp. PtaU1.Bin097]